MQTNTSCLFGMLTFIQPLTLGQGVLGVSNAARRSSPVCPRQRGRKVVVVVRSVAETPEVLCHGELIYDLMSRTVDARKDDEAGWEMTVGGGPTNVAVALRALGVAVSMSSPVGDDRYGALLAADMASRGMDVSHVRAVPGVKTRRIFVRVDPASGEREFDGYDGENGSFADAMQVPPPLALPGGVEDGDDNGVGYKVLVSGTLGLAFKGSGDCLRAMIAGAHAQGVGGTGARSRRKVKVVLDVNWRDMIWVGWEHSRARAEILSVLRRAHIVKASTEDLEFLFGSQVARQALKSPERVLHLIENSGGEGVNDENQNGDRNVMMQGVFVTAGEQGSAAAFRKASQPHTILSARTGAFTPAGGVVNTTGAGDGYLAAVIAELVKDGDNAADIETQEQLADILRFAARVGGVVVSGKGACDPLRSRAQAEMMAGTFTEMVDSNNTQP